MMLIWDASLLYIYDEKPLISDILGKTYAKTLQSMVTFCVFCVRAKNIRNIWGAADGGEIRGYNYLFNLISIYEANENSILFKLLISESHFVENFIVLIFEFFL